MKSERCLRMMRLKYVHLVLMLIAAALVVTIFTGCLRPKADSLPTTEQAPLFPLKTSNLVTTSAPLKLCFTRGDFIYVKELASGKEVRLLKGQSPEISPDGKEVLFMSGEPDDTADPWRIRLLDLNSKRVEELPALARLGAYNAHWSNDGSKIAFESADAGPGTAFGQFNPVTGEWKIITRSVDLRVNDHEGPFALNSWAPNDKSLLIHSLEHLYEVSVTGKLVWQMPIAELGIGSETRFSLSSDKRYLLFDSTVDTKERPVNDVVNLLDVSTKKLVTITPDTVEARTPIWLPSEKAIIFECMKRLDHPHQPSICTIDVDGKNLSVLVNDAQQVSYSCH